MARTHTSQTSFASHITVAGCGEMGAPMLAALHKAGFSADGFDVTSVNATIKPLMLSDSRDISRADILMVVVRDKHQIHELLFDHQCVYADGSGPKTLIVSSTVAPDVIHDLRQRLPLSIAIVDAPMSGAPHAAEQATLSYMLGGADADIQRLMPIFQALGEKITHVGPLGSGMMAKVLNNYVAACSVVAVRRSLARARVAGLDTAVLKKIMSASSGATWYGDNLERISWASQTYDPGNTIGIIEKDVKCALEAAASDTDDFDDALLEALRKLPAYPSD